MRESSQVVCLIFSVIFFFHFFFDARNIPNEPVRLTIKSVFSAGDATTRALYATAKFIYESRRRAYNLLFLLLVSGPGL